MPTPIEPIHVVDTHALIWYLLGDRKLSRRALAVFHAAERGETRLIIPSIVLAEMYYANAKNKWFPDYTAVHKDLLGRRFFKFLPFDNLHDFKRFMKFEPQRWVWMPKEEMSVRRGDERGDEER
ncbi:MAG: PIN domain-containing protein [Anaerolineae bacterium]|nr:PIN domain-containing protein [Anaerolineae bacterium]NUQ06463.1 PIN domain-containing protein [Anaerolineae bacterium]